MCGRRGSGRGDKRDGAVLGHKGCTEPDGAYRNLFFTFHFPVSWAKALAMETFRPTLGIRAICELGNWKLRRFRLQEREILSAGNQSFPRKTLSTGLRVPTATSTAGRTGPRAEQVRVNKLLSSLASDPSQTD